MKKQRQRLETCVQAVEGWTGQGTDLSLLSRVVYGVDVISGGVEQLLPSTSPRLRPGTSSRIADGQLQRQPVVLA